MYIISTYEVVINRNVHDEIISGVERDWRAAAAPSGLHLRNTTRLHSNTTRFKKLFLNLKHFLGFETLNLDAIHIFALDQFA